ncbi:GNAT family N-acetyltransferase [Piscibacillus salipiscarius]|uniref:GNAT family N-acetyltransferase n=1 Tax=Piscibacillus salipiscarius TaxID=299480 RepID=A0ABW5Q7F3_9BACI
MNPILIDVHSVIETERLFLRAPKPGDGPEVNSAIRYSLPELKEWLDFAQTVPEVEDTEVNLREAIAKFFKKESFRYIIFEKETEVLVGVVSFDNVVWDIPKTQIGFWINSRYSGKGYMTEAVEGLTNYGLEELGFQRIEILCDSKNTKSRQVPERLGYELEGILKNEDRSPDGTELRDTCVYAKCAESSE